MKIDEEIIKKEKELILAETRASIPKLKELVSEDFVEIGQSGRKFGFQEVLKELPAEKNLRAEIFDVEFRMITGDVAQLFYVARIFCGENDEGSLSRRTSIWKNESGNWKIVFNQGTRLQ